MVGAKRLSSGRGTTQPETPKRDRARRSGQFREETPKEGYEASQEALPSRCVLRAG